jgi:hypothetical protein
MTGLDVNFFSGTNFVPDSIRHTLHSHKIFSLYFLMHLPQQKAVSNKVAQYKC